MAFKEFIVVNHMDDIDNGRYGIEQGYILVHKGLLPDYFPDLLGGLLSDFQDPYCCGPDDIVVEDYDAFVYAGIEISGSNGEFMAGQHTKNAADANFASERMKTLEGLMASFGQSSRSGRRLIADTAAIMHAVGDYRLLRGVRLLTTNRWVELPDGTRRRIVGVGRIELEHFSIPNVHLIARFHKNLISMSQLDADHGMVCCFGKGKCEIMLADGTVIGGGFLEDDGMYVLRFLEVPEPAEE